MKRLALILFPLLGGCFFLELAAPVTTGTSDWYHTGPVVKPRREIYRTVLETVKRQGYKVTSLDPEQLFLETGWSVHLSSHWREGFRTMLQVELVAADRGGMDVRVRALREINDNAKNPIMESEAMWIPAGMSDKQRDRIPVPAMRLQQSLKLTFFGFQNG